MTAGYHRHALTAAPLAAPGLRVLTYNILADQYAASDYARSVLFSYCPQQCGPASPGSDLYSFASMVIIYRMVIKFGYDLQNVDDFSITPTWAAGVFRGLPPPPTLPLSRISNELEVLRGVLTTAHGAACSAHLKEGVRRGGCGGQVHGSAVPAHAGAAGDPGLPR